MTELPRPYRLNVPVTGMTCASCVRRVEKAISSVPGVAGATVNLASEQATVTFAGEQDTAAVIAAVRQAGYGVASETLQLGIGGMTCAACVRRVEAALTGVPGVISAAVNPATERALVSVVGGTPVSRLDSAIRAAGYSSQLLNGAAGRYSQQSAKAEDERRLRRDVLVAAVLTLPLFIAEMGGHLVPAYAQWLHGLGSFNVHLVYLGLATAVLFGPGLRFYRAGLPALARLAPDMNALVVMGATAAWAYSVVSTFNPAWLPPGTAQVYFESAAVIVTLVLVGRLMEVRAKGRAGAAIQRLVSLQPKTARIERAGAIADRLVTEVLAGDIVHVRPGERLPVDGLVLAGSSFVDQAMITGEPVPVQRGPGDEVVGGTINKTGSLSYRATRVGEDTVLAQIIQLVERAQGAKLPIQAQVDRITAWFVPAVMLTAIVTFLAWLTLGPDPALSFALVNAVAVLIIACPCAMGLATPTSIMVGTGRAAELGVLFRNGEALESLRSVRIVAFDKTGTLTKGRPELTDLEVAAGSADHEALALAAAVEARSEHPVATAIVAAAQARGLVLPDIDGFEAVPGHGAVGHCNGRTVAVGASRYMAQLGVDVSCFAATASRLAAEAKTIVYVADRGRPLAIMAVSDQVKPSSAAAVAALRKMGLRTAMITGDTRQSAAAVARSLGIDDVVAEVLPEGKLDAIRRLAAGQPLAFVGDGINDAPALAAADVGIAVGTGTDVAIESADIVLMSGDLTAVSAAIGLSRATLRNIRENLFWAFGYNVALIPVAAGVLYPLNGPLLSPMIAAGAMALSSLFVVGNALRLRRFKPS
ncbi:heavy metal translocating P-type ATPase [Aestuariivirga sp.]|uniref:heavy metal translocating P-type ATPase n=1 Tax=Aestuariivirga sp. TaxID=2650926 RepID=UPI003784A0EF